VVTKIELKLALMRTSPEYLLSHVTTVDGEVHHYVMKDGMTTACGQGVVGARRLSIEKMRGRLCKRCVSVVKALE